MKKDDQILFENQVLDLTPQNSQEPNIILQVRSLEIQARKIQDEIKDLKVQLNQNESQNNLERDQSKQELTNIQKQNSSSNSINSNRSLTLENIILEIKHKESLLEEIKNKIKNQPNSSFKIDYQTDVYQNAHFQKFQNFDQKLFDSTENKNIYENQLDNSNIESISENFDQYLSKRADNLLQDYATKKRIDKPDIEETRRRQNQKQEEKGIKKKLNGFGFKQLRSRTETPSKILNIVANLSQQDRKEELEQVDERVHVSFLERINQGAETKERLKSPSKLMQQHIQRQQKAEMLRAQIVQNKQKHLDKIRMRQENTKSRLFKKQQERDEKKEKLRDKLKKAREYRKNELSSIKARAQNEIDAVADIKYIMHLTMNNLVLDINNKMQATARRRTIQKQEFLKKLEDQKQKEEEVQRRRMVLNAYKQEEIRKAELRRQRAAERKSNLLLQKQKTVSEQEKEKRQMVLARKNTRTVQNVIEFVNKENNIWELIGNEKTFREQANLFEVGHLFDLEKQQLKLDKEFLDKILIFDEQGKMQVKLSQEDNHKLMKMLKGTDFLDNPSSDDSEDGNPQNYGDEDEILSNNQLQRRLFKGVVTIQQKQNSDKQLYQFDDQDNKLLKKSVQEEDDIELDVRGKEQPALTLHSLNMFNQMQQQKELSFNHGTEGSQGHSTIGDFQSKGIFGNQIYQPFMTDEEEQMMLIESRIYNSIKRNVLRDTMSEDLEWALCIKNENEDYDVRMLIQNCHLQQKKETRSLQSTPEKIREKASSDFGGTGIQHRERSCDDRIFGSASSNRRFKKSSRLGSRKSSISSSIAQGLSSRSKEIGSIVLNESKNLRDSNNFKSKHNSLLLKRDNSKDSFDSYRRLGRGSIGTTNARNLFSATQTTATYQNQSLQGITGIGSINQSNWGLEYDETDFERQGNREIKNYGSQMNQMITNMKPMPSFKILPKLSINAQKYLFPIKEQMILFKRPGKLGEFANARVTIRLEDAQQIIKTQPNIGITSQPSLLFSQQSAQKEIVQNFEKLNLSSAQAQNQIQNNAQNSNTKEQTQKARIKETILPVSPEQPAQIQQNQVLDTASNSEFSQRLSNLQNQSVQNISQSPNQQPSNQNFQKGIIETVSKQPVQVMAKSSPYYQNDQQSQIQQGNTLFKESAVRYLLSGQYNDLLRTEDTSKSIELRDEDPEEIKQINNFLNRLEKEELNFRYCRLCECMLHEQPNTYPPSIIAVNYQQDENKPPHFNQTNSNEINLSPTILLNEFLKEEQSNYAHDSPQKSTPELNIPQAQQNQEEQASQVISSHLSHNKQHKKIVQELGIKEIEDQGLSILSFSSSPGDISKELAKEKEKALKRNVKRLKVQLQQITTTHDGAGCQQAWKDYSSANKKTLQIRCLDLEKQVNPVIRDYDALEQNLKEIIRVLQGKNQGDLMLFRKLKFIPTLVDICKRILICPKNEFKHLGKAIELSIKIISVFCTLRENRNYMLQTNRIMPLVELLTWCLNRPTQLFVAISFLPQLFQIITLHIKHRCPYECIQSKELLVEILICSSLLTKIKNKFSIINYPMAIENNGQGQNTAGQVPLFLLKSITFFEAITTIVSTDTRSRPVYERNEKLGEHYLFVVENTEMFGVIEMLATLLLTHCEQFKSSSHSQLQQSTWSELTKAMPQTYLSISVVSMKVLNNIIRMDYIFLQQLLIKNLMLSEQLYHLINYLLVYCHENYERSEDTQELLHETLLFIGYFCLENEVIQEKILTRGENTILQKLCNLPFPYFTDKKLKEILFPTLIQVSYKNQRCLAIMDQEISFEPLIKFIKDNLKEELPRIIEEDFDHQSMSSLGDGSRMVIEGQKKRLGKKDGRRSPSISSTSSLSTQMESITNGNCPYLPLQMRFPRSQWPDAIEFYQKMIE